MVNEVHLYSAFPVFQLLKAIYNPNQHSPIYSTMTSGFCQHAHQKVIHKHSHTNSTAMRSNLGLSILIKGTLT